MRDRRNTSLSLSSVTSSRSSFSEKRCLSPPPATPALPSPVTKEHRPRRQTRTRFLMALKVLTVFCSLILLWRLLPIDSIPTLRSHHALVDVDHVPPPSKPTAILASDRLGRPKWTVSIPQNLSFPLPSSTYRDICEHGTRLGESITKKSRFAKAKNWRQNYIHGYVDHTFMEISEAENIGKLSSFPSGNEENICEKSLTFAMDTEDASFGKTLLMLWLSYGLAKKEGRAFFLDDTRWPYGRYSSYFTPPLAAECTPPPSNWIVPCPHSAKHLIITAATASWTFGTAFRQVHTAFRKHDVAKNQRIFELARRGYEDLFHLVDEDAQFVSSRVAKLREEADDHGGPVVGMQIRRGNLHPFEYQFSRDYLPLGRYAKAAHKLLRSCLRVSQPDLHGDLDDLGTLLEYVHSPLLLTSDDPEMLNSAELLQGVSPFTVQRAQDRIQLATKAALDKVSPAVPLREPGSAYIKHVDENSGWEGGFYDALFFGLGGKNSKAANSSQDDQVLSEGALRLRQLVGRAYLLDLAVMSQSDGVVCAVSSATCRALGVMMGWHAVSDGAWVNVDDKRVWSWDGSR